MCLGAVRKSEVMKFTYIWMYMEGIVLSELSQRERNRYRTTAVNCGILYNTHTHTHMHIHIHIHIQETIIQDQGKQETRNWVN